MIESSQNKKAMLIGNGLNRLDSDQSFSWGDLLEELKDRYSIEVDLENFFKPFPLAFDEMQHLKSGRNSLRSKLKNLKQSIKTEIENQLADKRGFNDYHQKLASLDYDDILTTNYDYSLEKSIEPNFINKKRKFAQNRQERKFSLKRCYKLNSETKLWHIHGELFDSRTHSDVSKSYPEESIMIGYEHYANYLEKIQENIKGKSGSQKTDNQSLTVRIRDNKPGVFWTDILFTHNIDIIGQAIDFSENHLWWIFNYRANLMREGISKNGVQINNRIRFFYAKLNGENLVDLNRLTIDEIIWRKNSAQKSKAIGEVLKAFKIEPIAIECNSHEEFYDKLIDNYLS
jgi:hypothetical protein